MSAQGPHHHPAGFIDANLCTKALKSDLVGIRRAETTDTQGNDKFQLFFVLIRGCHFISKIPVVWGIVAVEPVWVDTLEYQGRMWELENLVANRLELEKPSNDLISMARARAQARAMQNRNTFSCFTLSLCERLASYLPCKCTTAAGDQSYSIYTRTLIVGKSARRLINA